MESAARLIPSIERLRQSPRAQALEATYGREAVVSALRAEAAALRAEFSAALERLAPPDASTANDSTPDAATNASTNAIVMRLLDRASTRLARTLRSRLQPVINATGVIIHTNLGRAPLCESALDRMNAIGRGYVTLEYDLERGSRGRRDVHAEPLLCQLTGADAAIVVNNNAAAVLLVLSALANGREVIISRGELVEIGGGFRVPDVMRQSGALLREVGTTNRTRIADYAAAISDRTALILRVHPSNFVIQGFTERPKLDELASLGQRFNVPVAEDLGSGYLEAASEEAGERTATIDEPTVQASLRAGVDIVTFSGDKLLGGPQAGIIAGRHALVDTMRRHPLMRALRIDKLTYAALEATLLEYARGRAAATVPVQRMLNLVAATLTARASAVIARLSAAPVAAVPISAESISAESISAESVSAESVSAEPVAAERVPVERGGRVRAAIVDGKSAVGGGSAPGLRLPTPLIAIEIDGLSADALFTRLRDNDPPIIARIDHDRVVLDLRTVLPDQDEALASALLILVRESDHSRD